MSIFAERLQALRTAHGVSQYVLSSLCGLSEHAVRRYERGESVPTLPAAVALADFFNVSLDYLVGRSER